MQVTITGEFDAETAARIVLDFRRQEADTHVLECDASIRVGSFRADGVSFLYYGWNIQRFIDELARLYDTLEGEASLNDWDNPWARGIGSTISIEAIGRRGRMALRGCFPQLLFGFDLRDDFGEELFGFGNVVIVAFRGAEMDQSYLPQIMRELRAVLRETGISTEPPSSDPW